MPQKHASKNYWHANLYISLPQMNVRTYACTHLSWSYEGCTDFIITLSYRRTRTYVQCTHVCVKAYDPFDNVISPTKPHTNWTQVDQPVFPIWWRLTYSFHLLSTIPESVPSLHSRSHKRSCPNNHSLSLLICQREEWRSNSNIKWSRDTQLTRQWAYICTRKNTVRTSTVGHTPFVCLGSNPVTWNHFHECRQMKNGCQPNEIGMNSLESMIAQLPYIPETYLCKFYSCTLHYCSIVFQALRLLLATFWSAKG